MTIVCGVMFCWFSTVDPLLMIMPSRYEMYPFMTFIIPCIFQLAHVYATKSIEVKTYRPNTSKPPTMPSSLNVPSHMPKPASLLLLDSSRWLARRVVNTSAHTHNLITDPRLNMLEEFPLELVPVRRHEVCGRDGS